MSSFRHRDLHVKGKTVWTSYLEHWNPHTEKDRLSIETGHKSQTQLAAAEWTDAYLCVCILCQCVFFSIPISVVGISQQHYHLPYLYGKWTENKIVITRCIVIHSPAVARPVVDPGHDINLAPPQLTHHIYYAGPRLLSCSNFDPNMDV